MTVYQIITIYDSIKDKSYFYSYVESSDTSLGNMTSSTLPAYLDINQARACYYSAGEWIFDADKYAEILEIIEAEKEEADRLASIPNTEGLYYMVLDMMESIAEIATTMDEVVGPLTALASLLKTGSE